MQNSRYRQPAKHHLQQPQPENFGAHPPQPARGQFQPDEEQQQGNAQLGNPQLAFRIADQPQDIRPKDCAGQQVAKGRAQPQPPEQQHEYQGGPQQQDAVLKEEGLRVWFHEALSASGGAAVCVWRTGGGVKGRGSGSRASSLGRDTLRYEHDRGAKRPGLTLRL